jgi:hypothetical protein
MTQLTAALRSNTEPPHPDRISSEALGDGRDHRSDGGVDVFSVAPRFGKARVEDWLNLSTGEHVTYIGA